MAPTAALVFQLHDRISKHIRKEVGIMILLRNEENEIQRGEVTTCWHKNMMQGSFFAAHYSVYQITLCKE